jgi:hypothetical protein
MAILRRFRGRRSAAFAPTSKRIGATARQGPACPPVGRERAGNGSYNLAPIRFFHSFSPMTSGRDFGMDKWAAGRLHLRKRS